MYTFVLRDFDKTVTLFLPSSEQLNIAEFPQYTGANHFPTIDELLYYLNFAF